MDVGGKQPLLKKPLANDGRLLDGSEPTVLRVLGPARSTYHYYHPEYRASTLYCADRFAGKSNAWLFAYPWVAYCAPYLGGMSQDKCGQCMRMTNNRTGKRIIVRIADMCGHGAIDADQQSAFMPLDSDGQGYLDGQLSVMLELVAC
ncbi:pathogenesis-related PR-4-like [Micractinium conductrix]|uniref:Pathogenesis-related PR-4-like n=1 Tax=Micractinium conductrix TaxID=554055 RepID=A0A2P6VRJ7_9CHLO|nr:pathogenesis-related PR-4-like [Micractinium conductrix]|eukprot:PSC76695.1 pathogenesis-related PR-4-like [Micractinium conductrix]